VGGWPNDFRIPDLVLLTPARAHIDRNEYFEGGPDVVVEVCSPDDETYEKLEFYTRVGVGEVWIIDRDTRLAELYQRSGEALVLTKADQAGWLYRSLGLQIGEAGGQLLIGLTDQPETIERLP